MLRISMTPDQVKTPEIFELAVFATVMGTNPEWNDGKVTYKFDDVGIQMLEDDHLMKCIEVDADITGIKFFVEVTPEQLNELVPDHFIDSEGKTWIEYMPFIDQGIKGKHLLSAVHIDNNGTNVEPDANLLRKLKGYFNNLIFLHAEESWRNENQLKTT